MSDATVTYRVDGKPDMVILVDVSKHSVADLLDACRRRVFPGEEPPKVDAVFDRIMAERARLKAKAQPDDGRDDG